MPLHLDECDVVRFHSGEKLLPQVDVLHIVLGRGAPAVLLPCIHPPLQKRVHTVLRIAVYGHVARLFQHSQPLYDRFEFHAVIGGGVFASAHLAPEFAVEQYSSPAAVAGIARTCAVRIDVNVFLRHRQAPPTAFCTLPYRVLQCPPTRPHGNCPPPVSSCRPWNTRRQSARIRASG